MTLINWQWIMPGLLGVTLLMPAVRRYALHHGLRDLPGERRLHEHEIARGGGISIVLVMLIGIVFSLPLALVSVLLIAAYALCALTGWLDDHRPLSPWLKFILLAIAAGTTIAALGPERLSAAVTPPLLAQLVSDWPLSNWLGSVVLGISLLWLINLFNFMDGSHGLTASQSLLGCIAMIVFAEAIPGLNALTWLLIGCLAAFLPWNFPRPLIFLGDVGSLSLGLLSGWLLLSYVAAGALHPMQALLIPGVFLVDATATLLMRMLQGEVWFKPHTRHAYQCLVQHGWGHTRVCLAYAAVNLGLVFPALWLSMRWPGYVVHIVLACFVVLTLLWSVVQLLVSGVGPAYDEAGNGT